LISAQFRQKLSQTINTKALLKILPSRRLVKKLAKSVMLWYPKGMTQQPPPDKKAEWAKKAALKDAVVPNYFEVFTTRVEILCGQCQHSFKRTLMLNVNEPIFVCPKCSTKNWIPVTFDIKP